MFHIEVFHLNKLLVPSVQIRIQMYFNPPDLFLNGVALHGRLTAAGVKVKLYLCQVKINPFIHKELMQSMDSGKVVSYPMVDMRSEPSICKEISSILNAAIDSKIGFLTW